MNKLVVAFASLLSVAALACGSQSSDPEPDEETRDVTVDVESSVEPQYTLCRQIVRCVIDRHTYGSLASCEANCASRCYNEGTCCSKYCRPR